MSESPPAVCAIVLNWNSTDDTLACVAALARQTYPHCRVLVVDNGSRDDSVARIRAAAPEVALLAIGENRGYAGGNNRGIAQALQAGCDYVWLLNPDAEAAPDALAALLAVAAAHPRAGLLGPKVTTREDPSRILSAGGILQHGCVAVHRGLGEIDRGQFDAIAAADFVTGCAVLARRALIEAIGGLDESFFVYQEDVDWSVRARRAGFEVLYVPGASVVHPDTRVRDADSPLVTYYITRNTLRFARKHGLGAATTTRLVAGYARTLASWTLRPKWRAKGAQRAALARALRDFALGRSGPAPGSFG